MNQQKLNICPVCEYELSNGVCGNCGYIRLIFPYVIPESIKLQEEVRTSKYRKFIEENKQLRKSAQKEIDKHQKDAAILQQTVNDQNKSIAKADEELRQLRRDHRLLLKTKESIESKLSDSQDSLQKARSLSETLRVQNMALTTELAKARDEIAQMHKSAKAGNVYFILDDEGEFSVIPVSYNRQFFATGPGIESCRVPEDSITMLPVMTTTKVAFAVEKSLTGGYSLTDLAGTLTSSGATKGNKIRLTQGVSLKIAGNSFKLYFCINQQ